MFLEIFTKDILNGNIQIIIVMNYEFDYLKKDLNHVPVKNVN